MSDRDGLELRLARRAPFDAGALLDFFGRRAVRGVEEVSAGVLRRSLRLAHGAAVVELEPTAADVLARMWLDDPRDREECVARCRALLDLDADPRAIAAALGGDPAIGTFVRAAPGLRVPGAADAHELAVRAVLGQQISLAGAATLASRLVVAHGEPLARPRGGVTHVFPSAAALSAAGAGAVAMPRARRRALEALTGALASGEVLVDDRSALLALPGIGPWTASYIAMRAGHDRDAFLPGDLGVRHALRLLGQDDTPAAATRLAERWRPYRAYAVQHLWRRLTAGG